MQGIRWKINRILSSFLGYDPVTKIKMNRLRNPVRIGTDYGGWVIPENFLHPESICYLAGAGEDISFDAGIAEKYRCHVYIFDPTPKAVKHVEEFKRRIAKGEKMPVNNSSDLFYHAGKESLPLLHFYDTGLWKEEAIMKFYVPQNPAHASYSILNIQKTGTHIEAKVDRISNVMKRLGHSSVDVLKLDIDGAEYNVLQSVIDDNLDIKVICVEYDEALFSLDENYLSRIKGSLRSLIDFGYVIADTNEFCNYTLVRRDVFKQLN